VYYSNKHQVLAYQTIVKIMGTLWPTNMKAVQS
jgi:hypothetical protein